ncbi:hypothetical protein [Pseudoxanthomonas sp.]|uniref:hypothetical protein n=1 Tax=Pseudoxanthomonas sp. TaxID=1871049 RepID=UPI002624D913|nr:hypothetical protein [Pseudoxanthomonas sp.]WDS37530.1 MAG: hypothetical protein O8I58_06580 [Pseudoxanthomonas sp.]
MKQSFRTATRRVFLLSWQKEAKPPVPVPKRGLKTLADAAHRCPVLLAGNGTARELASLKHPRLFGHFRLRCSARFEGAEDQERSNNKRKIGITQDAALACALKSSVRHGEGGRDKTRRAPHKDVRRFWKGHGCPFQKSLAT